MNTLLNEFIVSDNVKVRLEFTAQFKHFIVTVIKNNNIINCYAEHYTNVEKIMEHFNREKLKRSMEELIGHEFHKIY